MFGKKTSCGISNKIVCKPSVEIINIIANVLALRHSKIELQNDNTESSVFRRLFIVKKVLLEKRIKHIKWRTRLKYKPDWNEIHYHNKIIHEHEKIESAMINVLEMTNEKPNGQVFTVFNQFMSTFNRFNTNIKCFLLSQKLN